MTVVLTVRWWWSAADVCVLHAFICAPLLPPAGRQPVGGSLWKQEPHLEQKDPRAYHRLQVRHAGWCKDGLHHKLVFALLIRVVIERLEHHCRNAQHQLTNEWHHSGSDGARVRPPLTWDCDSSARVDDAAVGSHAVAARSCGLHFETYSSVRRVLQLQVGGYHICERSCTQTPQNPTSENTGIIETDRNVLYFSVWVLSIF